MKKWCSVLCLLSLCVTPLCAQKASSSKSEEQLLKQISHGFSQVAQQATPAVVYIETQIEPTKRDPRFSDNPFDSFHDDFINRFFGFPVQRETRPRKETARGTGFFVTPSGHLITNNHLVEGATKVTVSLQNGETLPGTVVGTDAKTDLAVIKVEGKNFPYLEFADTQKIEVGDWAIAIGNPFGLQSTLTVGVVSAKGRSQLQIADFEDFIQTDAAINPGNSGGPLLNVEGHVMGVNTAIASASGGYMGIGFAIPSHIVQHVMQQLIDEGSVTRGFLGVTLQPVDKHLASYYSIDAQNAALVTDVVAGSPADVAGIKPEDLILAYDGHTIDSIHAFRTAISLMAPGTQIVLKIQRDGAVKEIKVKIAALPAEMATTVSTQRLGIKVQPINKDLARQLGVAESLGGLVITEVESGTAASLAGLRPGVVIVAVNRKKVDTLEQFQQALQEASKEGKVLLKVVHGDIIRFVVLQFDS